MIFDFDLRSSILAERCVDASGMHRGCIVEASRVHQDRHMHLGCRDGAARIALRTAWGNASSIFWRLPGELQQGEGAAWAVARTAVGAAPRTTAWAASRTGLIAARVHRHGVRVRSFRPVKFDL